MGKKNRLKIVIRGPVIKAVQLPPRMSRILEFLETNASIDELEEKTKLSRQELKDYLTCLVELSIVDFEVQEEKKVYLLTELPKEEKSPV